MRNFARRTIVIDALNLLFAAKRHAQYGFEVVYLYSHAQTDFQDRDHVFLKSDINFFTYQLIILFSF